MGAQSGRRKFRYDARAMDDSPRKSSTQIALVLLGVAAVAGVEWLESGGLEGTTRRDVYASKADCLADWREPKECEEGPPQNTSGGRRTYWYGPSYGSGSSNPGYQAGAPRTGSRALGSHGIARGGFGGFGHRFGFSGA